MSVLSRYEGKRIKLITDDGTEFTGTAEVYPSGYGLHVFNRAEESILIENTHIFHSSIRKIEELSREIKAGDISFSIVIVDMNDLKRINDKYGHKMGDFYINGCCHLICEHFKHSPVYRIGGDEFVIILKGVDYENRVKLVESLKNSYAQTYANPDVKPWERYSAAVGMADLASDDKTIDLVFKRADKAMYEDKHRFKMEHGSYR